MQQKNEFHAVLSPTNAVAVSVTVAAQRHAMTTASKTAQRFRELHAQSQHFFSCSSLCLCVSVVNRLYALAFAEHSLTPADLHYLSATAAKAATFSLVPAVVLQ